MWKKEEAVSPKVVAQLTVRDAWHFLKDKWSELPPEMLAEIMQQVDMTRAYFNSATSSQSSPEDQPVTTLSMITPIPM